MIYKIVLVSLLFTGSLGNLAQMPVDVLQALRQQCHSNHSGNKTEQAENALMNYKTCLEEQASKVSKAEVEDALKSGVFTPLLKKYCDKSEELNSCLNTASKGVAPCLDSSMLECLNDITNGYNDIIDFVCYKEGERVLQFVSGNGLQCLKSNAVSIQTCMGTAPLVLTDLEDSMSPSNRINIFLNRLCGVMPLYENCLMRPLKTCASEVAVDNMRSYVTIFRNALNCKL